MNMSTPLDPPASSPRPVTPTGIELLEWCDRVQYDDRNRERIVALEQGNARELLLEFGQWLADNLTARRGMEESFDSDEPDEYAATIDAFLEATR